MVARPHIPIDLTWALLLAILVLLPSQRAGASPSTRPIAARLPAKVLTIGEALILSLRPGEKLFISRKGYLAVHQLTPERFRLIALKKGELVVLVKDRSDHVMSQRSVIIRPTPLPARAKPLPLPNGCRSPTTTCLMGTPPTIKGTARRWQQYYALRSWCQRHRCDFRLKLAPEAWSHLQQYVHDQLGDQYRYQVRRNGVIAVCHSSATQKNPQLTNVAALLDSAMWQVPLTRAPCRAPTTYMVEAIAFRLQVEDAERFGLNIAGQSLPLSSSQNIKLHAFLAKNRTFVVGHPTIRVAAGQQSEFATGSEFFVPGSGESGGQWKQLGFAMKLKLTPLPSTGEVLMWYQVEITAAGQKGGAGASPLSRSFMASTMTVALESPLVVAELNTLAASRAKAAIPVVDGIPIIGPLLRQRTVTHSHSRLFLWLHLRKAKHQEPVTEGYPTRPMHHLPVIEVRHRAPQE